MPRERSHSDREPRDVPPQLFAQPSVRQELLPPPGHREAVQDPHNRQFIGADAAVASRYVENTDSG